MDVATAQSPFAVLTFIVAPALLTNASSVLALSTINRMLRTRERMTELLKDSAQLDISPSESMRIVGQVNRVERQAILLLRALYSIYVALGAFVSATLVTLLGAGLAYYQSSFWFRLLVSIGLGLGFIGVGGLVTSCVHLFHATQLSLTNIREEATLIRQRRERTSL